MEAIWWGTDVSETRSAGVDQMMDVTGTCCVVITGRRRRSTCSWGISGWRMAVVGPALTMMAIGQVWSCIIDTSNHSVLMDM